MGRRFGQGIWTLALALAAACAATAPALGAIPIPEGPDASTLPVFIGAPAKPHPISGTTTPQNPFMAPNGRSNLHDDAYMTNTYSWSGPLGNSMQTLSTFQSADCASLTVDKAGRLLTVCVGLEGPREVADRLAIPREIELHAATIAFFSRKTDPRL